MEVSGTWAVWGTVAGACTGTGTGTGGGTCTGTDFVAQVALASGA